MDLNNETDKKWVKRIVFALICGFLVGAILKKVLSYFLVAATWNILKVLIMPASLIVALLIVLYLYDRSKTKDE